VPSNGNVNFTTYNCVAEPAAGRLLSSQVDNNGTAMTIEKCLAECWMYAYAGVEYGRECWCGNTLNWAGDVGNLVSALLIFSLIHPNLLACSDCLGSHEDDIVLLFVLFHFEEK
jgi:hypothetical protein